MGSFSHYGLSSKQSLFLIRNFLLSTTGNFLRWMQPSSSRVLLEILTSCLHFILIVPLLWFGFEVLHPFRSLFEILFNSINGKQFVIDKYWLFLNKGKVMISDKLLPPEMALCYGQYLSVPSLNVFGTSESSEIMFPANQGHYNFDWKSWQSLNGVGSPTFYH